jgi:hypothetical protein
MKRSDVGRLLMAIAATDNRTVGMLDIDTWHAILPAHLSLEDAHAALIHHRQTSTEWLQPKHIIDAARQINRDRWQRIGIPPIPGDLTLQQEKAWRIAWCAAAKAGDPNPIAIADTAIGITTHELPANPEMAARIKQLTSKSKGVNR